MRQTKYYLKKKMKKKHNFLKQIFKYFFSINLFFIYTTLGKHGPIDNKYNGTAFDVFNLCYHYLSSFLFEL